MTTLNPNQVRLTPEGLADLKTELEDLVKAKRPRMVERLSNARLAGDLSENSDYISAKEELEFLDGRIAELEHVIKNAFVVKKSHKSTVDLGTKVTLTGNGTKLMFYIVGEWEADPKEKKISHESPLGSALIGKKVGDAVEITAPVGKVLYKILSVE